MVWIADLSLEQLKTFFARIAEARGLFSNPLFVQSKTQRTNLSDVILSMALSAIQNAQGSASKQYMQQLALKYSLLQILGHGT